MNTDLNVNIDLTELREKLEQELAELKAKINSESLPMEAEKINHPPHYNSGQIEVIDAIEDWNLGFHLGNVVKYVARAQHKNSEWEDLKKAAWYLSRYIEWIENRNRADVDARAKKEAAGSDVPF